MSKYVSFSLWGSNPVYCIGAIKNAMMMSQTYPGWKMVVFYDETVPVNIVNKLNELDSNVTLNNESTEIITKLNISNDSSSSDDLIKQQSDNKSTIKKRVNLSLMRYLLHPQVYDQFCFFRYGQAWTYLADARGPFVCPESLHIRGPPSPPLVIIADYISRAFTLSCGGVAAEWNPMFSSVWRGRSSVALGCVRPCPVVTIVLGLRQYCAYKSVC